MSAITVSAHAIRRYRERVGDIAEADIVAALSTPIFHVAARMGRCAVIMRCGARAIVQDGVVVTVLPIGERVMSWARHPVASR